MLKLGIRVGLGGIRLVDLYYYFVLDLSLMDEHQCQSEVRCFTVWHLEHKCTINVQLTNVIYTVGLRLLSLKQYTIN